MKPTEINAGFRTIKLKYHNEDDLNNFEYDLMKKYHTLHISWKEISDDIEVFSEKFEEVKKEEQNAVKMLNYLEKNVGNFFDSAKAEKKGRDYKVSISSLNDAENVEINKILEDYDAQLKVSYKGRKDFDAWIDRINNSMNNLQKQYEQFSKLFNGNRRIDKSATLDIVDFQKEGMEFYKFYEDINYLWIARTKDTSSFVNNYYNPTADRMYAMNKVLKKMNDAAISRLKKIK